MLTIRTDWGGGCDRTAMNFSLRIQIAKARPAAFACDSDSGQMQKCPILLAPVRRKKRVVSLGKLERITRMKPGRAHTLGLGAVQFGEDRLSLVPGGSRK